MNAALCPRCRTRDPKCPLCKGRGIFDASNPATVPMLGDLGIEWSTVSSGLVDMGKDIVSNLAKSFPNIATNTLTSIVSSKLSSELGGGTSSTTKTTQTKTTTTAPTQAAPAQAQPIIIASGTPGWLLPAGIAAGGVALAAALYLALRKKD